MFDLIIFDCDGTLVDSEELNNIAFSNVLTDLGLSSYTPGFVYQSFVGMNIKDIAKIIEDKEKLRLPTDLRERFIQKVEYHAAAYLRTIDGALDNIQHTIGHLKTCVASNGERPLVLNSLKASSINSLIPDTNVFTASDVANGKPAPDLFLHAAKTMNAAPDNTLVIEDTVTGVTAAIAAGMHVIGFTGAHGGNDQYAERLNKAGAHRIMHHWSEFPEILKRLHSSRSNAAA